MQKRKSITDSYSKTLIPMVELHSSLWLEDMRNYKVSDFIGHGSVSYNPDILNGDPEIILKLKMAKWNIVPLLKNFFMKGYALQNYIYLYDTDDGIDIYHYEPLKSKND
jgi:hypothetical protein